MVFVFFIPPPVNRLSIEAALKRSAPKVRSSFFLFPKYRKESSDNSGHDKRIAANYSGTYVESTEKKQLDLYIRVLYRKEKYLWFQ